MRKKGKKKPIVSDGLWRAWQDSNLRPTGS